ncbi:MAG TPA: hypothetical protein VN578_07890 [Candidatus Binatia bacterium]|jgi:hypothetical protein|nr:hypothetical protein [Candidatus Binatia bacterium]
MPKIRLSVLALASVFLSLTSRAQFADSVVAYTQGSGVNASYANPSRALGAPTTFIGYQNADLFNPPYAATDLTEIGAGGSLTLQFNTPIRNDPGHAFGLDFIVFGHAGFMITNGNYSGGGITDGSFFTGGAASTRVSVSADGLTFYTLNPALAPGVDGLFPTDASGDFHLPVNPGLSSSDFAGKDLTGIRGLYAGSGGGAGYDLSWAQDGGGQGVSLSQASFVRVDVLSGSAFVDAISLVPEPGVDALGGFGVAVLLGARRSFCHKRAQRSRGATKESNGLKELTELNKGHHFFERTGNLRQVRKL